jgi:serine/threonine protein kinase
MFSGTRLAVHEGVTPASRSVASQQDVTTQVGFSPPSIGRRRKLSAGRLERGLLQTPEALVRGDLVAGRYRLSERLARGGMGMVWAAIDETNGAHVVVKTMSLGLDRNTEAVQRFRQEADVLAAIDCPHIVRFVDTGVVLGAPFLVLERLWGEDLAQCLALGRLPLEDCRHILDQMALALCAAHARGIVHRDLKPANIFLARQGDGRIVKLLDFGVAKLRDGARVRTGAGRAVGSPTFMSPEQIHGDPVDGRSDLFGLGAVIYACATGRSPFHGADLHETFRRILAGDFTPPSTVEETLPPALDDFFATALAIDPAARFQDAAAMARSFQRAVDSGRRCRTQPSWPPPPARPR